MEWNLLGKLLPSHGHFKTVTKINMKDVARESVQRQVRRMSVRNIRQLSSCSLSMHADASLIDGQSQWIRNNPHNLTMHY